MTLTKEQTEKFLETQCRKCIFHEHCNIERSLIAKGEHKVVMAHEDKLWCKGFVRRDGDGYGDGDAV